MDAGQGEQRDHGVSIEDGGPAPVFWGMCLALFAVQGAPVVGQRMEVRTQGTETSITRAGKLCVAEAEATLEAEVRK